MLPNEQDAAFLWDMLNAAQAVQRFVGSRKLADYLTDEVVQSAVERKIEIIGEAARKVSTDFQQAHSEIPWSKIMRQRNVLAHDYGRIEHDRLWAVITIHLPELVATLRGLVPQSDKAAE
jgi:uncharacterized protein with HEPN domain